MSRSNVCPQLICAENVFNFFRSDFAFRVLAPFILSSTALMSRWSAFTETFVGALPDVLFLGFFAMTPPSVVYPSAAQLIGSQPAQLSGAT
jgi:hypothetical protein